MIEIAGLIPFSTVDYPNALSSVIFCQGCPWKCSYCHNPHLQPFKKGSLNWKEILDFLRKRIGFLDSIVFSGGEPTFQKHLLRTMHDVKEMGFKVGLHTAGIYPQLLKPLLPWIDWVGMDIKAPFLNYGKVSGVSSSGEKVKQSAFLVLESGVDYEFRTTVHPKLITPQDIEYLTLDLEAMGAKNYALQKFRSSGCANRDLVDTSHEILWEESFLSTLRTRFKNFSLR